MDFLASLEASGSGSSDGPAIGSHPSAEVQKAVVKTVTFHNPDNGFTVLKCLAPGSGKTPFTAVGNLPRLTPGETLDLTGTWTQHGTFGRQLQIAEYRLRPPDGREALERYLAGGAFKGIGPALAKRIVEKFGEDTFTVIDREPARLREIKGMSPRLRQRFLVAWDSSRALREVMVFLQAHQITLGLANRIVKHYGPQALDLVKENPYRLAEEVWGIGFLKADAVARKLGFPPDSYERLRAGLAYALQRSADEGHVYLERDQLRQRASELLQCEPDQVLYTLDHMEAEAEEAAARPGPRPVSALSPSVKRDEANRCYLPWLYHCEAGIAKRAALLRLSLKPLPEAQVKAAIDDAEAGAGKGFAYSAEQREGIALGVNQGLFLLTGGPGTGKTTTVLGLLRVLTRGGLEVRLAAPTGRAAKRLSEVTGHPASTLHRLLKYDPASKAFVHGEGNPLPGDALILDEVSMIDTALMFAVLKAVRPGMRLILVGDPDQLPSVGPGKVLAEFIAAGVVPHLHLSQVFRQAEASLIVTNAHRIRQGLLPEKRAEANYHFVERGDPAGLLEACLEVVCDRLPKRFGYDPFTQVQVLTPMNQGPLGTHALNQALQERLNPTGPSVPHRDRRFREHDRVMQLKNDYDKNVFNGDVGYVLRADPREKTLLIDFDGENVRYEEEDFDQLTLAYAATIHKSQGSEFKAVVCLVAKAHWVMLQRNLLYTAVTRAREQLLVLGQWSALHRAVSHHPTIDRNTQLAARLREAVGGPGPDLY